MFSQIWGLRTLLMAGLKLCASLRRELRSCWKPCSSGGEAWWSPAGPLLPTDPDPAGPTPCCCCRRHTLVLITSRRSHKSSWTTWRETPAKQRQGTWRIFHKLLLFYRSTQYRGMGGYCTRDLYHGNDNILPQNTMRKVYILQFKWT